MRQFLIRSRSVFTLLFSILSFLTAQSQWTIGGSTNAINNGCYRLTTNNNALSGFAYEPTSINLNDSFDLKFLVNLGSLEAGADGIMFVLRSSLDPFQLIAGGTGGSIGFTGTGLENGSIGVEFDTYQNIDLGDPSFDHIAIFKNASTNHNLGNVLTSAVQASSVSANIEDGANHSVRIKWNPTGNVLSIYFDCALRLEYTGDIINNIFSGNSVVYYGFIGTTGGVSNTQSFCIAQPIDSLINKLANDTICPGQSVSMNAGSNLVSYSWTPSTGLNSSSIHNPTSTPQNSITYTVTESYHCETRLDTIQIEIFETDKNSFTLGNDTIICAPDSLTLDLSATNYLAYLWNDGSTGKLNVISSSQITTVSITDQNSCTFSDTIVVEVRSAPAFSLGADRTICAEDSVDLSLPYPINFKSWSNGSTSSLINVKSAGIYWVEVSNDSICFSSDTVIVQKFPRPDLNLGNDTTLCANALLILSAESSNADSYIWSDGSQEPTLTAADSGLIWVNVLVGLCHFTDTIFISPSPVAEINLGNDTSICKGDSILIEITNIDGASFLWNTGNTESRIVVREPLFLSVEATTEIGCKSQGQITISEKYCPGILEMPNVFSPNNDLINDYFKPISSSGIEQGEIIIFNRWGQKIYSASMADKPWDGTVNGRECANGIYFWTAFFKDFYGKEYAQSGSLTLLR